MNFSLKFSSRRSIPECEPDSSFTQRSVCQRFALVVAGFALCLGAHWARAEDFKVGVAQIDISTRMRVPMGGYGTFFLGTPRLNGVGVHDPLFVSAVLFESAQGQRAAVVALDAVGLSGAQISRIELAARVAVDPNLHLIIAATHTHHSPDTLGLWGSLPRSGRDERYAQQIESAAVQAVRDAYARRELARVTQRTGRHANSTTSSAAEFDVQDGFVSLGFYSEQDDRLLGTLTQWSAHPTVLGMENNALSADFVGGFRQSMQDWLGTAPHVYLNGAIGKVYPLLPTPTDSDLKDDAFPNGDRDPDVRDGYRYATTVGYRLAQAIKSADERAVDVAEADVAVCHVPVRFPVDNKLFRLASSLRVVETKVRNNFVESRISALTVGPLVFASIPGEAFPKIVNRLDAQLFRGRQPLWVGLGQDWLGYFVEPEDYNRPDLKYWTDLSIHHDASGILTNGLSQALRDEGCKNFQSIESSNER